MMESGLDYVMTFWSGVDTGRHAGGDRQAQRGHQRRAQVAAMRENLAKVGAQASPGSPQDFADFIAAETENWSGWAGWAQP